MDDPGSWRSILQDTVVHPPSTASPGLGLKPKSNHTLPHSLLWLILVPLALALVQVAMYFSGSEALQYLIAPDMPGRKSDREFGILENSQSLLLWAAAVLCVIGSRRKKEQGERWLFGLASFGFLLMTLEEADYGLHFYEHFRGIHVDSSAEFRNLHNQGETTYYLRKVIDLGTVVFFILLPVYHHFRPIQNRWLSSYAPSIWYAPAAAMSKVVSEVAHLLQDLRPPAVDTLEGNVSEFREFLVYALLVVYLVDLVYFRKLRASES